MTQIRAGTRYEPSPMYFIGKAGQVREAWSQERRECFKENFSICQLPNRKNILVTVHAFSHCFIVWNGSEIEHIIDVKDMYPFGVGTSRDGKELMVTGSDGQVRFFSTDNFIELKEKAKKFSNGPVHVLTVSV